ncbi:DUF6110 family protein [bacterium 210917-SL.2.15]|nr:DUF6110 family protein [bacterium 210917-SL.2.15]
MNCYKNLALFAGGVLFGSAGIKLLSSKDAKKAYTHTTAAVLRMKETVMDTVTTVRENAGDILAEAKELNEQCAAREEVMEDAAEESGAKV